MTTLEKLFNPAQRQRLYEAIPARYSCRSYAGAPSTADWASLSYAAERYALPGARLFLHTVSPDIFTGIVLGYGDRTVRLDRIGRFAAHARKLGLERVEEWSISPDMFITDAIAALDDQGE